MNPFRRWTGRFGLMFLVPAVASVLLSVPNVALGTVTELLFASDSQAIGVAASRAKLLFTRPFCGNPREVKSVDQTGAVSTFATLPSISEGCREEYLAIAPAAADFLNTPAVSDPLVPNRKFTPNESGFASGFVYVTQGSKIIKIAPDGSAQTTFKTFSGEGDCGSTETGINFDRVGNFDFFLAVVCNNGKVWLLNKDGNTVGVDGSLRATPIFNLRTLTGASGPFEGPDFSPNSGFEPYNKQMLVAAENASVGEEAPTGKVFAVTPTGTPSTVAAVRAAEGVAFIPSPLCNFGSSGGTYFSAVLGMGNGIFKLPQTAITGSGALVPSESGVGESPGITQLTSNGTNVTASTLASFRAEHQGSAFCIDSVPINITGFIRREPADPINPNAGGVITVKFFPIPGIFNPFNKTDFRAGITGAEKSWKDCEKNPVEGGARLCHFFMDRLGITCPATGPCVYRGLLHFKAVPGDGACGDG